jgi:hypothetical protein
MSCPRPVSDSDDPTVYLVMNDLGEHGRAFIKTDITEAGRDSVVRNLLGGQMPFGWWPSDAARSRVRGADLRD